MMGSKEVDKGQNKRSFIVIIIIVVLIIIGIVGGLFYLVNGNDDNNFVKDKKVGVFSFEDFSCEYDGSVSDITYTVVNTSKKKAHLGQYDLIIKSSDGEIIASIQPNYNIDLKAGKKYDASNRINIDLCEGVEIDINMVKN